MALQPYFDRRTPPGAFRTFFELTIATAILFLLAMAVRSCGKDEQSSVLSIPPPPKAVEIKIDGYTAMVPPGPGRLPDVPEKLMDAVRRGIKLVSDKRLDKEKCVPKGSRTGWKACLGDYIVVAVDKTDKIQVVDVYGGISTSPPGFTVTCEREGACDSGVNPPFVISAPPGWTAVAIRTAVFGSGEDGIDPAVYVPYSSRLNDPELRQAGIEYLRDAVLAAYYELRAKDVRSRYIPDKYVTDFGTPDHIIALILTEQMLSDKLFAEGSDLDRLNMLDRALVTLGLNRWKSYKYTASRADARGIGQIVGKPYKAIHDLYPHADLPQDDIEGRTDHHSAIKTMIAHTDAEWWAIKEETHRLHLLNNETSRRIVMAAGYNASIGTVIAAIAQCGNDAWRLEACTKLPGETRRYLVKYEWIYNVIFDPAFRAKIEESVWPTLYERDQSVRAAYEKRKEAEKASTQATN
ncbi:hypothetical protein EPN81_00625 [Patescibacteria group bacterium]|nr:MAG: hypothetical protein EPN81_00625 [Patescibacteria group bacterium]